MFLAILQFSAMYPVIDLVFLTTFKYLVVFSGGGSCVSGDILVLISVAGNGFCVSNNILVSAKFPVSDLAFVATSEFLAACSVTELVFLVIA